MDRTILGKTPGILFSPGVYSASLDGTQLSVWGSASEPPEELPWSGVSFADIPSSGTLHFTHEGITYTHTYTSTSAMAELIYLFNGLSPALKVGIDNSPSSGVTNIPVSITAEGISTTYHRGGKTGLFISKPGANVMSCSDGDLLFDSTSFEFLSVLTKGRATVYRADNKTAAKETSVYTLEPVPNANNDPVYVSWNVLLPATNLHSTAYSSSWNTSFNEGWVITNAPFLSLDVGSLGPPQETGFAFGTSLTAITRANTDNHPASANTVDIIFKNGSPNKDIEVQWTLYRESGDSDG